MPTIRFCWRCGTDMPMLSESEWERIAPFLKNAYLVDEMQEYRAVHGCSQDDARSRGTGARARRVFQEITGMPESNFSAILHHRANLYGPDCGRCGKPLRTPQARYCATCDWVRP